MTDGRERQRHSFGRRTITISGGIVAVYFLGPLHSFLVKKDHAGAAGTLFIDARAVSVLERTRF
jgi:hypothetical protein